MSGGNQLFKYDIRTKQIVSLSKKLCLDANVSERSLKFAKCDETLKRQRWTFSEFVNGTALLEDWYASGRKFNNENPIYWHD